MEFNKQNILNKVKAVTQTTVVMDEGLRAYMLKVYNYMATGVLLTGIVALISFNISVVTDASGALVSGELVLHGILYLALSLPPNVRGGHSDIFGLEFLFFLRLLLSSLDI